MWSPAPSGIGRGGVHVSPSVDLEKSRSFPEQFGREAQSGQAIARSRRRRPRRSERRGPDRGRAEARRRDRRLRRERGASVRRAHSGDPVVVERHDHDPVRERIGCGAGARRLGSRAGPRCRATPPAATTCGRRRSRSGSRGAGADVAVAQVAVAAVRARRAVVAGDPLLVEQDPVVPVCLRPRWNGSLQRAPSAELRRAAPTRCPRSRASRPARRRAARRRRRRITGARERAARARGDRQAGQQAVAPVRSRVRRGREADVPRSAAREAPDLEVATTVEPQAKLSGSTSVACSAPPPRSGRPRSGG